EDPQQAIAVSPRLALAQAAGVPAARLRQAVTVTARADRAAAQRAQTVAPRAMLALAEGLLRRVARLRPARALAAPQRLPVVAAAPSLVHLDRAVQHRQQRRR